jgi:hypothetical protein
VRQVTDYAARYATLLADPPWDILQRSTGTLGAEEHYELLPMAEIAALPVGRLAAPDAHLAVGDQRQPVGR